MKNGIEKNYKVLLLYVEDLLLKVRNFKTLEFQLLESQILDLMGLLEVNLNIIQN
jgi:hypothetical protein